MRVVDVFVDDLDLGALEFEMSPAATGRPAYHLGTLLKPYVYGYLNKVQSNRWLEREVVDGTAGAQPQDPRRPPQGPRLGNPSRLRPVCGSVPPTQSVRHGPGTGVHEYGLKHQEQKRSMDHFSGLDVGQGDER